MNPDSSNRSRFWTPTVRTDLGERADHESLQSPEAAMEHSPRTACHSYVPLLRTSNARIAVLIKFRSS
jgi:hypothetical protein